MLCNSKFYETWTCSDNASVN